MIFRDSRVWRYFFKNLAWPVGIVSYILAVTFLAGYVDTLFRGGAFVVCVVFFILPTAGFLIREMWKDAVDKVDRDNEEIMRRLRN